MVRCSRYQTQPRTHAQPGGTRAREVRVVGDVSDVGEVTGVGDLEEVDVVGDQQYQLC